MNVVIVCRGEGGTIGRVRPLQHSWGKFKATGLEVSLDF